MTKEQEFLENLDKSLAQMKEILKAQKEENQKIREKFFGK